MKVSYSRFLKNTPKDSVFYGALYLMFALPIILFLSVKQPMFYTPDEGSHFNRAYQVANGLWFPTKHEVAPGKYDVGGMIEHNLHYFNLFAGEIYNDKTLKLTDQRLNILKGYRWSGEDYNSTVNVSIYPPFLYLPQALGIYIGQTLDISIASTVTLSRVINAISAMLIALTALLIARRGVVILFMLLMLPMTLAQFASASQDALCMSFAALCAALFTRVDEADNTTVSWGVIFSLCGLIFLMSTSRPPYLGLASIFLAIAFINWRNVEYRNYLLAGFAISVSLVIAWICYITLFVSVQFGPEGVSYSEQLKGVISSPLCWFSILFHTWHVNANFYMSSFFGNFGYLDTPLPYSYYYFSLVVLSVVFFSSMISYKSNLVGSNNLVYKSLLLVVLFVTICGVYLVLYVSWTPVGASVISGVQGRYLIPVALFICLLGKDCSKENYDMNKVLNFEIIVAKGQKALLLTFCIVTSLVIPWTVAVRHY
jgi:uncharacterized membrane protein